MNTKTTTIKATLDKANTKKPAQHENTPLCSSYTLVAKNARGELCDAITVRCYFNPRGSGMQPVRASVWTVPADRDVTPERRTGRGSADECGYHKESAAIAEAFDNAGILFWGNPYLYSGDKPDFKKRVHFGGTGDRAYAEIFKAAAKALGYRGAMHLVRS